MALWLTGLAPAALAAEFSATMVQKAPNQPDMTSKLYVSGDNMREETSIKGEERIRIHDKSSNITWLLNPKKKQYVEFSGEPAAAGGRQEPPLPDEPGSPCLQDANSLQCTRLGVEKINGREAEKWRFVAPGQGRSQQAVEWTEWFDKELRIPIRGEGPSGMVRELNAIEVGPQPADLFEIPAGYEQIEMPQRAPQGRR
ncbi:MAG: hypothetical protein U5S82_11125 [Gammaproteobacteria bacterium]|nr:hypothetical protein [Gammaproteobacteria bacterium]